MKTVARAAKIVLAGHDVSDWVTRWALDSEVGEIQRAQVDILLGEGSPLRVDKAPALGGSGRRYEYVPPGMYFINDTPIASHVEKYAEIYHPKRGAVGRLYLHADESILTINGTTPWREA